MYHFILFFSKIDPWPVVTVLLSNCDNTLLENDSTPEKIMQAKTEPKKEDATMRDALPKQTEPTNTNAAPINQEVGTLVNNASSEKNVQVVKQMLPPVEVQIEMDIGGDTGAEASKEKTIAAIKKLQENIKAVVSYCGVVCCTYMLML